MDSITEGDRLLSKVLKEAEGSIIDALVAVRMAGVTYKAFRTFVAKEFKKADELEKRIIVLEELTEELKKKYNITE